ncbi:hypothetical protein VN12_25425 [Pirellula sp. SH-Sr6A]|nr:hypothetical protein VN12_25425 [Pirellula sp. SH-Sr6A]
MTGNWQRHKVGAYYLMSGCLGFGDRVSLRLGAFARNLPPIRWVRTIAIALSRLGGCVLSRFSLEQQFFSAHR